MRKIYLSGDIDEDSFREFCEKMDEFEEESQDPIDLILNSAGGNALDAMAFLSRMRTSPCDITVTVYGFAGSAAVLVLAAGDYRKMTKEAWVMVHEDFGDYEKMNTSEIEKQAKIARTLEDHWSELLEEITGTKKEVWTELHKNGDLYIRPAQCVELGLVHEVV